VKALLVVGALLLAGCSDSAMTFQEFLNGTPPCPADGGTWIWDHLEEKEVQRAKGALEARGYTEVTTYGEAYPLDPPGGPYHAWTVIGQCQGAPT
jgi:hypothetical protein